MCRLSSVKLIVSYGEINGLKSEFTPVIDLVSGGKNALSANAKSLFEKYNLFDRCKNLRQGEITSCEANIVSTVESMSFLDSFESNVNSKLKTIDKLAKRMTKSEDVKESQDLKMQWTCSWPHCNHKKSSWIYSTHGKRNTVA